MAAKAGVVRTLGYNKESSLGSGISSPGEIRFTDETLPAQSRMLAENPTTGHAHPYKSHDSRPIPYEMYRENALSFTTEVRRSTAENTAPPIADFFESAGCSVATTSRDTIASETSTTDYTMTGGSVNEGEAHLIQSAAAGSGLYWPSLVADNTASQIDPLVALPEVTDSGRLAEVMSTIWPQLRQVPTDATLAFRASFPFDYDGGSDQVVCDFTGCALGQAPVMTIPAAAGSPFQMTHSFHVGKIAYDDVAFGAETFVDSERFVIRTDDFRFDAYTFDADGGIALSALCVYDVVIDPGFTVVPIASACNSSHAGLQGYMHTPGVPMVTLTADFDIRYIDDVEATLQTLKGFRLLQPTSAIATPAFGFWGHNAYLSGDDAVTYDHKGNTYVTMTLKYRLSSGEINSETGITDIGAAPWHMAISGEGSEA